MKPTFCPWCGLRTGLDASGRYVEHYCRCSGSGDFPPTVRLGEEVKPPKTPPKPQCPYCHAHTPTDHAGRLVWHTVPCLGSGDDPRRPGPLVETPSKAPQRPVETSESPEAPTPVHSPGAPKEGGEGRLYIMERHGRHIHFRDAMPLDILDAAARVLRAFGGRVDGPGDPPAPKDCDDINKNDVNHA